MCIQSKTYYLNTIMVFEAVDADLIDATYVTIRKKVLPYHYFAALKCFMLILLVVLWYYSEKSYYLRVF